MARLLRYDDYVRRNYLVNCDRLNACRNPIRFVIKITDKSCAICVIICNSCYAYTRPFLCPVPIIFNNIFHRILNLFLRLVERKRSNYFIYLFISFSWSHIICCSQYRFELHRITFPQKGQKERWWKNKIIAPTISFQLLNVFINVKRDLFISG